jgi:acetyl-CoA carboxylase biotin carboxyl carrier protein
VPDQPAEPGAAAAQSAPAPAAQPGSAPAAPAPGADTRELLGLIDKLEGLLAGSELDEIGSTGLLLRKPSAVPGALDPQLLAALSTALASAGSQAPTGAGSAATGQQAAPHAEEEPRHHAVVAPLTGIYYGSPSPGAAPYVREGNDVNVGQVIGLIEAMKLFNEIKSDVSGRVMRIVAESGKLVKHKQPLIEVEPS